MSMDLTGITNQNEYYTKHYFSTAFEENTAERLKLWNAAAKEAEERTPWALLRQNARQYYSAHSRYARGVLNYQLLDTIRAMADAYLASLGYPAAAPQSIQVSDTLTVPVYLEMTKPSGAPLLWVVLMAARETDAGVLQSFAFDAQQVEDATGALPTGVLGEVPGEELATKILFDAAEPPRFVLFIGMNQIALIDRNKWNEKRYLQFELEEIFSRLENTTLQAMAVLLHKSSLCPDDGKILLDELDEQSQKNASGVSQDLKYALRESIELLGNEVLYDMAHRQGRDLAADPVDAGQLTLECLRYMYRMLFVLFIESRPELGYAPMKAQSYLSGYSLESLREIADSVREDVEEVGDGYYLHETLSQLYSLIYAGYPKSEEELESLAGLGSLHDIFIIAPLKAHIFDPEYTSMITAAKLRNRCMLRIIDLMSVTRGGGKRSRRGRISYANLGINQMGAVYEALLSYRGFIAASDLYEVKRAGDSFNELDVGYFVTEDELAQYTEDERVRYAQDDPDGGYKKGQLRCYRKGSFIYRLAGREREKSASYYTPEVLTRCLVKYALQELLAGKSADEILHLTICEPAMGSAAFLNEAINQLAEAYLAAKQKELGESIPHERRAKELQKVKMFIADRNVYGVDLNPVAVELAEVSLWLNTIYEGGFVPWFGSQLVNGNSLIGARRQVYRVECLTNPNKGVRWYDNAPTRLTFDEKRKPRTEVYHFLLGDPGMCSYGDSVIKKLEPDKIKALKNWNKKFTSTYTNDEVKTLLRLSQTIDQLWEEQIKLQREVNERTQDALSVYGYKDSTVDSHTTIREKDRIYAELYKSEHQRNAGPYARLKFAMDYWCALWFWPIEQAELLPSRAEFLFDMSMILEGTIDSAIKQIDRLYGQTTLYPMDEVQQLEFDLEAKYGFETYHTIVDIPALCRNTPRLALVQQIAAQNHFMHWELEFADLFARRGGFDLIVGNPPWIKVEWNEQGVLADRNPMFAVKKLTATETTRHRAEALADAGTRALYFSEYESMAGQQSFLNAYQNYPDLKGQQTNLFKCFLPQAWMFANKRGVSAFVHPEGVYDDPKGGALREKLYARLRKHFMFANERKLFPEVDHHTQFSLNVYGGPLTVSFDTVSNLYDARSIVQCYEGDPAAPVPGIKDENDEWNTTGHPSRIIHVTKKELAVFAKLFDGNDNWKQARLPVLHESTQMQVLEFFSSQENLLGNSGILHATTKMFDETNSQKAGIISSGISFPESKESAIFVGPYCNLGNPFFQTVRNRYTNNSDYDVLDLTILPERYLPRTKYQIQCNADTFVSKIPTTPWGTAFNQQYMLVNREFVGTMSERTLVASILPPKTSFLCTLFGTVMTDEKQMVCLTGCENSIPFDFLTKVLGKNHVGYRTAKLFPLFSPDDNQGIMVRILLLNCLSKDYSQLWTNCWETVYSEDSWSKTDPRLSPSRFSSLTSEWSWATPLRTDYERRQALVEIDVLTAMALGMTLEQLKTIYRIQFPVLQSYEADTWYDADGRIVFTNNRSLTGVGFTRPEFENGIKGAAPGRKFTRTITDDTQPGGPVQRTITYTAPFTRCDREQDYDTAWRFFEEKYKQ